MSLKKFVTRTVKNFYTATDGSIIPLFAASIPVIFGISGIAIEYSKISNEKTKLESALDSTVLNIGSEIFKKSNAGANYRTQFEEMFQANMAGRGMGRDYKIENFGADKATGELYASVSAQLDTSFMGIFGYDSVQVEAESAAVIKQPKTEITMMLDTTGSMGNDGKIEALKKAANGAIDIFFKDPDADLRVGLVPYSATVNIGEKNAQLVTERNMEVVSISGFDQPYNNVAPKKCVSERSGRDRATDTSYETAPIGSHTDAVNNADCPNAKILPLTNNKSKLKQRINSMKTDGGTAGHLGVAWSYYMLSDKWSTLWNKWNTKAVPAAYGKATKIAIIMTDGKFNTAYEKLGGGNGEARSSGLALELCEDMKAQKNGNEGVIIYSVAFKAPTNAQTLLKTCANNDTKETTYYYSADNEAELSSAFNAIAQSITKLRLSR